MSEIKFYLFTTEISKGNNLYIKSFRWTWISITTTDNPAYSKTSSLTLHKQELQFIVPLFNRNQPYKLNQSPSPILDALTANQLTIMVSNHLGIFTINNLCYSRTWGDQRWSRLIGYVTTGTSPISRLSLFYAVPLSLYRD